jgi:hypothetical protein
MNIFNANPQVINLKNELITLIETRFSDILPETDRSVYMNTLAKDLNVKLVEGIPISKAKLEEFRTLLQEENFHIYHKTDNIEGEVLLLPLYYLMRIKKKIKYQKILTYEITILQNYDEFINDRYKENRIYIVYPADRLVAEEFTDLAFTGLYIMSVLDSYLNGGEKWMRNVPAIKEFTFKAESSLLKEWVEDLKKLYPVYYDNELDYDLINKTIRTVGYIRHMLITEIKGFYEFETHKVTHVTRKKQDN